MWYYIFAIMVYILIWVIVSSFFKSTITEPTHPKRPKRPRRPRQYRKNLATEELTQIKLLYNTVEFELSETHFVKILATVKLVLHVPVDRYIKLSDNIFEDLGSDSVDFIELIITIEELFDIEISDTLAQKIFTVDQLVGTVTASPEDSPAASAREEVSRNQP